MRELTIIEAKQIKLWRCGATGENLITSWAAIGKLAAEKWPEQKYTGNQIEGMLLCKEAAKLLGENHCTKPWN